MASTKARAKARKSNAWSHLPNAKHIDWVLQSVKDNPDEWNMARVQAWNQARAQARVQAGAQARNQAGAQVWIAARLAAWGAAWDAVLALVAYDDCAKYLSMTYDDLKVWSILTEEPASILLLTMVKAKELIEDLDIKVI